MTVFARPICALAVAGAGALLSLPEDRSILYTIYDDPDQQTPVATFTVQLDIEAEEESETHIGWRITNMTFEDLAGGRVWEQSPSVDALWWVAHADKNDPQLDEFDMPPHLTGVANIVGSGDDLDYDLEGVKFSGTPPFTVTAALDHSFALAVAPPIVIEEGEDEWVEVSIGIIDPDNY